MRSKAPLRLGFTAGGSDVSPYCDLYGGAVLNATIDMYAYCTIEPLDTPQVVFRTTDRQELCEAPAAERFDYDGPLGLHKGVYNRAVSEFNAGKLLPVKVTTYSDAPAGSGLGPPSTMMADEVPLGAMTAYHRDSETDLTMARKLIHDFDRHGSVRIERERIVGFEEKQFVEDGLINGSIYIVRRNLPDREDSQQPAKFSRVTDFLPSRLHTLRAFGFVSDAYFIDIGVPAEYARANIELGADA